MFSAVHLYIPDIFFCMKGIFKMAPFTLNSGLSSLVQKNVVVLGLLKVVEHLTDKFLPSIMFC